MSAERASEIDARGLECPLPAQRAVDAMRHARAGGDAGPIVVRTDDATCAADIPSHARSLGYDAESSREPGDAWTIILRPRATARATEQGR